MRRIKLIIIFIIMFVSAFLINDYFENNKTVDHFRTSLAYKNQATMIMNQNNASVTHDPDVMQNYMNTIRKSLQAANKVDTSVLNEQFDGLGEHYKNEFIQGLKLTLEGFKEANHSKSFKGQMLLDSFSLWYHKNLHR